MRGAAASCRVGSLHELTRGRELANRGTSSEPTMALAAQRLDGTGHRRFGYWCTMSMLGAAFRSK